MGSNSTMCQNNETAMQTVKVGLVGLELNEADYAKFRSLVMIPKEKQDQFLQNVINDMLHHLLYENPDLFNSYVQ